MRTKTKVRQDLFNPRLGLNRGVSRVKELLWYFCKILFFLTPLPFPSSFKASLLRIFGAKVGRGVVIKPRVNIHFPWKLEIANFAWIGEEVFILNFENIKIGSQTCISQRAFLCGGNHDFRDPTMPYRNGPIMIEDGAWVGASVFIGPNVVVGIDTVIAAGSVVSKSLEGNYIYRGNPAEKISKRWKE